MSGDLKLGRMAEHPVAIMDRERADTFDGGSPAPWLLASKVTVPDLPAGLVARQRLFELLRAGVEGPLTLLAAPAGFGKTVLLASWIATTRPHAHLGWVSLDADDNDAVRFWSYVVAALDRSGAIAAEPTLEALAASAPGARQLHLAPLINGLAGARDPGGAGAGRLP